MKKLLWVGDAACPSGFAVATHKILDTLRHHYDVTVLGMNYRGDPHDYPYPIYAASPGGDSFGVGRLVWMCDLVKPDVIVIQNDGWNIPFYMRALRKKLPNGEYAWPEYAAIPVVAVVAVDGKNFQGAWLDGVSHAIFWTQFALDEARLGGYIGPAQVVPLGVDTAVYYPMGRDEARQARGFSKALPKDVFIVGNVNRNQPRKRWDLTLRYFAEWVRDYGVDNAYLFLHCAPTGDTGVDVRQLADYYGIFDRVLLMEPAVFYGITEDQMRHTYNCFDVAITTTQGEGMGLTTLEAMACGVPTIVPNWAALGDWAKGAALMVDCPTTVVGPPYVNVLGGVPDEGQFKSQLQSVYDMHPMARETLSKTNLALAEQPRFEWRNIGKQYVEALGQLLGKHETVGVA